MKSRVVAQQQVKTLLVLFGEVVEEDLKVLRVHSRQFEKEVLAGRGFDCSKEVETFKAIVSRQDRLNPAGCDAMANNRKQSTTRFILRPQADLREAFSCGSSVEFGELIGQFLQKLCYCFRFFLRWLRRGLLGLAFN